MAIQTMVLDPNAIDSVVLSTALVPYIKTEPSEGQFDIKSIQRTSDGKLEVKYDDGV